MRRHRRDLTVAVAIVIAAACARQGGHGQEEAWLQFAWPEADRLFQRDSSWVGGDGAYSIDLGNGRVLWLFGDSWIDARGRHDRTGARMVSNTIGIQHGYDPRTAAIRFYWGLTPDGDPGAFFPDAGPVRYWPGNGVRVGSGLLLFLMAVRSSDTGLGFEVGDWEAVLVANPDADPPDWRMQWLSTPPNGRGVIVGSGGTLVHDGFVYAFGSREPGGPHDVYLVRWTETDAARGHLDAAQWWAGDNTGWTQDPAGEDARPVFTGGQTEFTVHRDARRDLFVEFQTDGFGAAVLVRRTAPRLTGPWSAPDTVFQPAQRAYPDILIYQGKAHPHLSGAGLVLTYCTNSLAFEDHLTAPWLYYPRFVVLDGDRPR